MKLKKYKLGDIGEIRMCKRILKSQTTTKGDIPFYKIGTFGKEADTFISRKIFNSYKERYNFPNKGDVLISAAGTIGRCVIYNGEDSYYQDSNIVWVNNDESIVLNDYLFYVLNNITWIPSKGSTILRLYNDDIRNKDFIVPNLEYQRVIADTLKAIDKKIKLNRQINDNLEAMAKQLYDYWFVQFDFPNEEGKPYKSSGGAMVWNDKLKREIPEGWYAENICKIANILSGGTPSKAVDEYWNNGTIPFFGPTDCNGSVFQIKTADHITQKGLEHCASSLLEEGIVIITARGSIGKLVIVGTPMAMNQSCYALQSKEGEYEYLYLLTTQLIDCLKAKGSGSVFKSIIASDIEHSTLCVATENVVSDFCKKMKPLFEKLKANTIEIAELTKQRDELLPLLINGQASVNYHLSDD